MLFIRQLAQKSLPCYSWDIHIYTMLIDLCVGLTLVQTGEGQKDKQVVFDLL